MSAIFIFDEYNEFFRSPNGAVKLGDRLRLRILVQRGAENVRLVFSEDGGAEFERELRFRGSRGVYKLYELELDFPSGLYWFYFRAVFEGFDVVFDGSDDAKRPDKRFQVTVYREEAAPPVWITGGIIYHIFVDRFNKVSGQVKVREGAVFREDWGGQPEFRPDEEGIVRNNDFFGGSILGIIEKLDYLHSLGVSCLYLSPIFEAASNHKYDTGDFMKIDPGFGDEETFKRLCAEAKKRGMGVILDGVFSHVGSDSLYFNRYGHYDSVGAWQSKASPYYDWFTFHEWNSVYESWWGIQLLPAINKLNPEYIRYICGEGGVISHWMRLGVSGWRLDVVDELPDAFLDPLCEAIRREKPDALIIGEVWEDASNKIAYGVRRRYFLGKPNGSSRDELGSAGGQLSSACGQLSSACGQLSSAMNYPLRSAIIACVKDGDVFALASTMDWLGLNYPKPALDAAMNILGTHDTMRILTALGGRDFPPDREGMSGYRLSEAEYRRGKGLLKLASLLQFTLPGVPCVYYGDEAGMQGGADPFNRVCYPWGAEDSELLDWYKKLGALRKNLAALKDGEYRPYLVGEKLFSFFRGNDVFVALNLSDTERHIDIAWNGSGNTDAAYGIVPHSIVVAPHSGGVASHSGGVASHSGGVASHSGGVVTWDAGFCLPASSE